MPGTGLGDPSPPPLPWITLDSLVNGTVEGTVDLPATEDSPFLYVVPAGTFVNPNDDALTLDATSAPVVLRGTSWLSFEPTTATFSGVPSNDDVGHWNVELCATDTSGPATTCDEFTVTVANTNDPPVAVDDHALINTATVPSIDIDVLANDFDPDPGDAVSFDQVLAGPDHGMIAVDGTGVVTSTPTPGYEGADQLTYQVVDGFATPAQATLFLEVAESLFISGFETGDTSEWSSTTGAAR